MTRLNEALLVHTVPVWGYLDSNDLAEPLVKYQAEVDGLKHNKHLLLEEIESTLSVEVRHRDRLQTELETIESEIADLIDRLIYIQMAMVGFVEQFSFEPLTWRYKKGRGRKGLPVFMVLDTEVGQPTFSIKGQYRSIPRPRYTDEFGPYTVRFGGDYYQALFPVVYPPLPETITGCYEDMSSVLVRKVSRRKLRVSAISSTFSGVVPEEVLRKVEVAKERKIFSHILMIAEVGRWAVESKTIAVKENFFEYMARYFREAREKRARSRASRDPLVVGLAHDKLWIIDKFDLKPLEEYAAEQFAWEV